MQETVIIQKITNTQDKYLKAKKFNRKIFPIYKMFSWDLLFYYSVNFLFLTQVKGFSASNVLLFDSLYKIFQLISQIPCVNIAETIGKRKSLIIANIFVAISIFILILTQNMTHIIIAYIFMGFGYSLKELCDSLFLKDCITNKEHPGTAFTNLDGKGSAYYYFFDAITSVTCGFLFVFNNYLPMILCFAMCIISCIFAFSFKIYEDPNNKQKLEEIGSYKQYFKDLKVSFRNIFGSRRLKSLLLFSGIFSALLTLRSTVASSLFAEIGLKEEYFGIIFAGLGIISAISSKYQNFFHKTLKNKVLTYFSLMFSGSFIIIGLTSMFSRNFAFTICVIVILYAVQYVIKGPYYTLIKRYLNSFTTPNIITKLYSVNTIIQSLFSSIICYFVSILLDFTLTSVSITIIGCIFFIVFILILDYMRDKIGLKPEEYKPSDINFTDVH